MSTVKQPMKAATIFPSAKESWTDGELMALPRDGRKYELIDGDLLMSPVGFSHSGICVRIVLAVGSFVRDHDLGEVCDSSVGYRLSPQLLLSPDVSFITTTKLKEISHDPDKFLSGAPDLAVEVLSPGDSMREIEFKADKYFEHGARLVWIVDPKKRAVIVKTPDRIEKLSSLTEVITGGDVLPGFKCKLSEIFGSV